MGYGIRVYILYGHRVISLRDFGNRLVQNHRKTAQRLYGNHVVIVQSQQPSIKLHGYRTVPVRLPGGGHAEIARYLCDCCVVLGIHVPNVYNFSFLIENTPKTNSGKRMRPKKMKDDQSQGSCMAMVRWPCDCRMMNAQYLCDFTGIARALCDNLVIATLGPYYYSKSLRSSCIFFVPNDHLKSCNFRTSACGLHAVPVQRSCNASTKCLRAYVFETLYNAELNKMVDEATAPMKPYNVVSPLYGGRTEMGI